MAQRPAPYFFAANNTSYSLATNTNMKNFTRLLTTTGILSLSCNLSSGELPADAVRLQKLHANATQKSLKSIDKTYTNELNKLAIRYLRDGNNASALAIQTEIKRIEVIQEERIKQLMAPLMDTDKESPSESLFIEAIAGKQWSWRKDGEVNNGKPTRYWFTLNDNGTGVFVTKPIKWKKTGSREITLIMYDKRIDSVLRWNADFTTFRGIDFGGVVKVFGEAQ